MESPSLMILNVYIFDTSPIYIIFKSPKRFKQENVNVVYLLVLSLPTLSYSVVINFLDNDIKD